MAADRRTIGPIPGSVQATASVAESRQAADFDGLLQELNAAAQVLPCLAAVPVLFAELQCTIKELRDEVADLRGGLVQPGASRGSSGRWPQPPVPSRWVPCVGDPAAQEAQANASSEAPTCKDLGQAQAECGEGEKDSVLCGGAPQEQRELEETTWREVGVRYFFKGQKAGQGKVCTFRCPGEKGTVPARAVRACLRDAAGVDLARFAAFSYCNSWGGFRALPDGDEETVSTVPSLAGRPQRVSSGQRPDSEQQPERECVDVQLEEMMGFTARALQELRLEAPTGFYGIGILRGKTETNHGLLWRSAFQLGASFTFTVGARYDQHQDGRVDRARCASKCPQWSFADFAAFAQCQPFGAPLVAVEMGGEPLDAFEHPSRCIYVLGSEDAGIESSVLQACHAVVSIPSLRSASFNVANAGSIVMYDRLAKERASQLLKQ